MAEPGPGEGYPQLGHARWRRHRVTTGGGGAFGPTCHDALRQCQVRTGRDRWCPPRGMAVPSGHPSPDGSAIYRPRAGWMMSILHVSPPGKLGVFVRSERPSRHCPCHLQTPAGIRQDGGTAWPELFGASNQEYCRSDWAPALFYLAPFNTDASRQPIGRSVGAPGWSCPGWEDQQGAGGPDQVLRHSWLSRIVVSFEGLLPGAGGFGASADVSHLSISVAWSGG